LAAAELRGELAFVFGAPVSGSALDGAAALLVAADEVGETARDIVWAAGIEPIVLLGTLGSVAAPAYGLTLMTGCIRIVRAGATCIGGMDMIGATRLLRVVVSAANAVVQPAAATNGSTAMADASATQRAGWTCMGFSFDSPQVRIIGVTRRRLVMSLSW